MSLNGSQLDLEFLGVYSRVFFILTYPEDP